MKKKKSSGKGKKIWLIVLAVFLGIGLIEYIVNPDAYKTEPTPAPTSATTATPTVAESATPEPTPVPTPEPTPATNRVTVNGYYALHGTVQSVITDGGNNGKSMVFKNKITPSYSNKATVDQNYYVVEDLVKNQGATDFEEIQYWAVADMTDGSESKVISFTVPKSTMDLIAGGRLPANMMGDYVTDLWILPSLQN